MDQNQKEKLHLTFFAIFKDTNHSSRVSAGLSGTPSGILNLDIGIEAGINFGIDSGIALP